MSASTLADGGRLSHDRSAAPVRLVVTWQHPVNRRIEPVGMLSCGAAGFRFWYLRRASEVDGFQPFLGFPDLSNEYSSEQLFPLFAQRVMSTKRADYSRYLQSLLLSDAATEWEILARSQGQREGDGIRVFLEPEVASDGQTATTFFVHGVRHRLQDDPSAVEGALDRLAPGQSLRLVDEPDNPVDRRALLVSEDDGVALGWVPSVLLDYVHAVRAHGEPRLVVDHVNGRDVPPGYRLLVTLSGQVEPGLRPFSGEGWAPSADLSEDPSL